MKEYILSVPVQEKGKRLDVFISNFAGKNKLGLSRTFIQKLIQEDKVRLRGLETVHSHYKVKANDEIKIEIEDKEESSLSAESIPLDVVYEDQDLAVINKPIGLVVHPAPGNPEHTLVNALLHRFQELSSINLQRPGIVHRLDKDTSGLIVIAKNNLSHLDLAKQFSQHTIKRKYIALVKGEVKFDEDVIEIPIGRHPHKRKSMSASFAQNTKYAKTYYRTLKRFRDFSFLELEPFTGRTHQLRVHLNFIGHPILGDVKYGKNNKFKRLALHAKYIGFIHPATGKFIEFSSAMPGEFKELINKA